MGKTKPRIYLAHPTKMMDYVLPYIEEIEKNCDVEIVNPFVANEEEACSVEKIRSGEKNAFISESAEESRIITEGDLKIINECDGMLAFLPREVKSFGTHMEVFYFGYILGRRDATFVVSEDFKNHPWVEYCTNEMGRMKTFEEFSNYVKENGFPEIGLKNLKGWIPKFYSNVGNQCKKENLDFDKILPILEKSMKAAFAFKDLA